MWWTHERGRGSWAGGRSLDINSKCEREATGRFKAERRRAVIMLLKIHRT